MGLAGRMAVALCGLAIVSARLANAGIATPRSGNLERCRLEQMAVSVGPYVSEETEQHTLALRLVNHGQRSCVLDGYPSVRFFDARGALAFRIRHSGDQMISAHPPKPVRVRPGGEAFLVLNKNTCVGRSSRSATKLELQTPSGGSIFFTFPADTPFRWRIPYNCESANDPGQTITVSPFVPSVRAAMNI